jgi:precorrin-6Y C5,15-methyltransferase (decarboxylating)
VIEVVGLTARGWRDLSEDLREVVREADLVVGSPRHLASISTPARTAPLPSPLRPHLLALVGSAPRVVVLASGDPLLSGIGSTLIELCGPDEVRVHPAVSSVALARARLGWPAESCEVITVVGRSLDPIRRALAPGRRLVVLSSDGRTPPQVANLLVEARYSRSRVTVLGDLGATTESRQEGVAADWNADAPALNVVCVECVADPDAPLFGWVAGLPDDAYEHDGQITKREVRAAVLARLAPRPGELLWDLGAGAGSVAIEWCRADATCRAVAVERDPARAARIATNASRLGVPTVRVVEGAWAHYLDELADPDAVFIGGGADQAALSRCWDRLQVGGRLVMTAVTWETEALIAEAEYAHGGEVTRIAVETLAPLGRYRGWQPARPVVVWSVRR